ncbi:hypothetical protein [Caulobacter sp. S45]|uniref:hypothetical protein n=1 Tax=Caulobacter sp. S45 TaxID=1641861 RepID=UPI00131BFE18|nr:hypothetical protein [Caulobacter sp. S45]
MMRKAQGVWRGGLIALALIALFVRVIAPPGFMVSGAERAGAFPLVICTGQGPLTLWTGKDKAPARSHNDSACAFAGHTAAPPPPPLNARLPARVALSAEPGKRIAYLAPGLGLAAPPPPSHAPPTTSDA